jgi:hypothetical protein
MGKYRFVKPATRHYDLSDGDWVEFKQLLSVGDKLKVESAGFSHVSRTEGDGPATAEMRVNWREMKLVRLLTWLAEWSFMSEDGKKRKPINRENIEGLDPDTFAELEGELDRHIESMESERHSQSGDPAPAPTA